MATANDIVRRALRVARVLDSETAIEGSITADSLDVLNALLAEWHEAEIGLPEYTLAAITTTTQLDAADREAVALQLAKRLAGEYGMSLMPEDQQNAQDSFARLRLRYFQPVRVNTDLPSARTAYDIDAG